MRGKVYVGGGVEFDSWIESEMENVQQLGSRREHWNEQRGTPGDRLGWPNAS